MKNFVSSSISSVGRISSNTYFSSEILSYDEIDSNSGALKDVDLFGWLCIAFLLLAAIVYGAELIGKFFKLIGKPLKWKKNRESDHDLILKNSEAIKELAELHKKDCENAIFLYF